MTSSHRGSSNNLLELYTKIPDYSEVKHLSHSDFINTLERLKEEFRQCRASLYRDEDQERQGWSSSSGDDVDFIAERATQALNINDYTQQHHHSKFGSGVKLKKDSNSNAQDSSLLVLSIKGCELHRGPSNGVRSCSGAQPMKHLNYNKPSRCLSVNFENNLTDGKFHEERYNDNVVDSDDSLGSETSTNLSKWSSSPDLLSRSSYVPPSNIESRYGHYTQSVFLSNLLFLFDNSASCCTAEVFHNNKVIPEFQRICFRRAHNNSAPSLSATGDDPSAPQMFKANPVPSHVYKPLYEFIMLKNQRRLHNFI